METDSGYGNWDSSCGSIGVRTAAAGSGHHIGDVRGQHRRRGWGSSSGIRRLGDKTNSPGKRLGDGV
jgi:hypothetical protein